MFGFDEVAMTEGDNGDEKLVKKSMLGKSLKIADIKWAKIISKVKLIFQFFS
jgi:hypothetical protein